MNQLIADIIGLLVTAACLISPHFKRKWQILFMTVLANGLSGLQYLILNQPGATGVCIVAIIQSLLEIRHSLQGTSISKTEIVLYSVGYIVGGLLPYAIGNSWNEFTWISSLPILGALLLMCSMAQKTEQKMRVFSLLNASVFTVYTAIIRSTQIFAQIISIVSVSTALFRYRSKKQKNGSPN